MPTRVLQNDHPLRIFFISGLVTLICLGWVHYSLGLTGLFVCIVLILVEMMFSFDNAIINARVLANMNKFWQNMFLTVGVVIAVFGVRFIFPILLVMATTGLGADNVLDLALHKPEEYAAYLHKAHPYIASFGGMFLLMLAFGFFFDPGRKIHWISVIERPLQRIGKWWVYTPIALIVLLFFTRMPWNHHPQETLIAGLIGIGLNLLLSKVTDIFGKREQQATKRSAALAGFTGFLYLQVLDASFSFDGVIGAFAVTQDVVLIAIGLGVGALWVRSLTILMVRRQTLNAYRYLEHGAHYTIGLLALVFLAGLFFDIPEAIAGLGGIIIVTLSITSSLAEAKLERLRLLRKNKN